MRRGAPDGKPMAVEPIGQILVRNGALSEERLRDALALQENGGGRERIGDILVREGMVRGEEALRALADQWAIPYMAQISHRQLSNDLVIGLRFEFLRKGLVLPLANNDGGVTNPANGAAVSHTPIVCT